MDIRRGSPAESPLQASKWLSTQALLEADEMSLLLEEIAPFFLFKSGAVLRRGDALVAKEKFLSDYKKYIDELRSGISPEASYYRPLFSLAMTTSTDALFSISLSDEKEIIRIAKPVIQMQIHFMSYSTVDKKFHPMVFGQGSIAWGVQFSYPQLFQDAETKQVEIVKDLQLPNTKVFHLLQRWMRAKTIPTPFLAEGILTNVPVRLGKGCLSWINSHPHLVQKGLQVE